MALGDSFAETALDASAAPTPLALPARPLDLPARPLAFGTVLEPGAEVRFGAVVHNPQVATVMRAQYSSQSLGQVKALLTTLGTLDIRTLSSGLPRAADVRAGSLAEQTGYDSVWTRDTAFIINAWFETGKTPLIQGAVRGLLAYYQTPENHQRMAMSIEAAADGKLEVARGSRPHIKFDGHPISDLTEPWGHAQNDALGLLLQSSFRAAREGLVALDGGQLRALGQVATFLAGIDYATDREYGHWEEGGEQNGKVSASSLRCVLQGLLEMKKWAEATPGGYARLQAARGAVGGPEAQVLKLDPAGLEALLHKGRAALDALLPFESVGAPAYERPADLALLTGLVWWEASSAPVDRFVTDEMFDTLLTNHDALLSRSHGDIRYVGDGYWGAYFDPEDPFARERLNHSSLEVRLAAGMKPQGEAQWTMGASLLSAVYGKLYQRSGGPAFLARQTLELNRALGMVTGPRSALGPGTLPESYMQVPVSTAEQPRQVSWTYTDNGLPLNWAKANLSLAMKVMEDSLRRQEAEVARQMVWQATPAPEPVR